MKFFQLLSFLFGRFWSADFEFKSESRYCFFIWIVYEMWNVNNASHSVSQISSKAEKSQLFFFLQLVLSCQVSWIRLSDLKLLTVGRYTYTTDLRFEGLHQKYSPDWKLVLTKARLEDSGKPPIMWSMAKACLSINKNLQWRVVIFFVWCEKGIMFKFAR